MLRVMTTSPVVATHLPDFGEAPMRVTVLHAFPPPALEAAWRELLLRVPIPSHYTSPEYFLEPYFEGKRPFAVLALSRQSVVGVLTGFHEGETVTCGLPTRPQIQLDPAADHAAVLEVLARGLKSESVRSRLVSIYSWEWLSLRPLLEFGYRSRMLTGNPVLDLTRGTDALLRECDGKRRNCIRYAMRHAVEVKPAETPEDYAEFYQIYAGWCAAKQTHCYPFETEQRAYRTTGRNRRLFVARFEGKIIAGSVFRFLPGGLVEYSRNSSLPEYQRLKPNDLLVWRAVEWACAQGFPMMSMGGSHRFLREFGGAIIPIVRYRMDRTLLRRYDRYEQVVDTARACMARLPAPWEQRIRGWIGKEVQAGW
jgi:hypothetical protein